jgi:hypothetical protein
MRWQPESAAEKKEIGDAAGVFTLARVNFVGKRS